MRSLLVFMTSLIGLLKVTKWQEKTLVMRLVVLGNSS